jgi:hypothetical protein
LAELSRPGRGLPAGFEGAAGEISGSGKSRRYVLDIGDVEVSTAIIGPIATTSKCSSGIGVLD